MDPYKEMNKMFDDTIAKINALMKPIDDGGLVPNGEYYWTVFSNGLLFREPQSLCDADSNRFNRGNYFKTEKQAKLLDDYNIRAGRYRKQALLLADGYKFVKGNLNLQVLHNGNNWFISNSKYIENPLSVYLPTFEKAKELLDWCNREYPNEF